MDKTIDNWARRLFYLGIAVVMILGLLLAPAITSQANAADVSAKWSKVATPYTDDWTVAPYSDIVVGASIPGGSVLYVVGSGYDDNDMNETYGPKLWKSEDSGVTWKDLADKVWKADSLPTNFNKNNTNVTFNYVACALDDPDFMAVALVDDSGTSFNGNFSDPANFLVYCDDTQAVVISDDGGDNFYWTRDIEDGNSTLKCVFDMEISVADSSGKHNIALGGVGTKNGTECPTGLVYRYESGGLVGGGWVDASAYEGWDNATDTPSQAVTKVAFAPSWLADKTVLAVSHTVHNTYLQSGSWGNTKVWNAAAGFAAAVPVANNPSMWFALQGAAAGLTLPTDYEGRHATTRYAWVYVDRTDGTGVIYKVQNGAVNAVLQQITGEPWLASISYLGSIDSGKAIAGALFGLYFDSGTVCDGIQVYRNDGITDMDICCQHWQEACKPPTGMVNALVGYVLPNKAYAFVGIGCESGFSFSLDDGDTWNQVGLVDTYISYLSDVAKSPNCNKTWVVSVNDWQANFALVCQAVGVTTDDALRCINQTDYNATALAECLDITEEDAAAILDSYIACACDSVWLKADPLPEASEYSGAWIREWCGELTSNAELNSAQTPEMGLLRLAPEETEEALTVYLVDRGTDKLYYDSTEGLGCWEPETSTVDNITDLAVQDEATIYALGFNADVAVSDDHGSAASWSKTMDSKVDNGHTIAVLGEGDVLVGGAAGKVSYSDSDLATFMDGDASFTELKDGLGNGNVHVAFDSYFDTNKVVYAAVSNVYANGTPYNTDDNGIYRWVIGTSSSWKDLGECAGAATPTKAQLDYRDASDNAAPTCDKVEVGYYGIVLSTTSNPKTDATTGGVLYATFYDADGDAYGNHRTGVARCLNPAEEVACGEAAWDYLIQDTADNHGQFTLEPSSLKICGCLTPDTHTKLWAIDDNAYYKSFANANSIAEDKSVGRLWTYEDCFAKAAPVIVSPADNALVDADPCYCWNDAFTLKWERQCDACSYNLQISRDADFTEVVEDVSIYGKNSDCLENDYDPSSGSTPSYVVANHALGTGSCGTTFYWRVRSADAETGEIIHSPWSDVRSFTVATGPGAEVTLTNPSNGAIGVAVTGIPFTWDAVPDATGFEFSMVNADGTDVVSATAVSGTTHTYTGTLSYNTSYFWTVKALKGTVVFGQATATFTTASAPVEVPPPTTPAWVWVVIGIGAVLVIVTLVLIFRTRRV